MKPIRMDLAWMWAAVDRLAVTTQSPCDYEGLRASFSVGTVAPAAFSPRQHSANALSRPRAPQQQNERRSSPERAVRPSQPAKR